MFGLPTETALVLFGFPALWLLYTFGFWILSRHWPRNDEGRD